MSRERDIRQAVVDLLTATDEFDEVALGESDPSGQAASDRRAAYVDPSNSQTADAYDGEPDGDSWVECQINLTISVRSIDPQIRDDACEKLLNVVRNALNGKVLVDGYTAPDFTKVRRWSWRRATSGQRDVTATLNTRYLEAGWAAADVLD